MEGYLADFQRNNEERLASKEVSAITSFCIEFSGNEASGMPNMPKNERNLPRPVILQSGPCVELLHQTFLTLVALLFVCASPEC